MTKDHPLTDDKERLIELAWRCKRSTGPDRELDALLHCVREELEFVCIGTGREAYGSICDPSDSGYGTANTTTPGMLYARYPDHKNPGKRGNIVQGCRADSFTASLDAAMTLYLRVPERVPSNPRLAAAEALCQRAAALKARASQVEDE